MTIKTARKLLPVKLKNLTDDEVLKLISELEILSEIFIETFEVTGSKKQRGVIDSVELKDENSN